MRNCVIVSVSLSNVNVELRTYPMITQKRQPLLQSPLCVDIASNKPSKEYRKQDAEYDPLDYDAFLDWC